MAKKKIFEGRNAYTYTIPSYMAPYLINSDPGDMSDDEIEEADAFAEEVVSEHGNARFIPANDGETYFGMPDVGGLLANCMDVIVIAS